MKLIPDDSGPGSRDEIVRYVKDVLDERTDVHEDTTSDRLARAITTSVLARLGCWFW